MKTFIQTREHFLIAADSIVEIEVVRNPFCRYWLRLTVISGSSYFVGNYGSEDAAWREALEFANSIGQVVSFD